MSKILGATSMNVPVRISIRPTKYIVWIEHGKNL